jgi:signal transduction histidine kinase
VSVFFQKKSPAERFSKRGYQGKLTQGEYRTGSGKGLFFADSVIKRHHGRIDVSSKPMSGEQSPEGKSHHNRFIVFIPYRQPGE